MAKTVMGLKLGAVPIGLFSETPGFGLAKPIAIRRSCPHPLPSRGTQFLNAASDAKRLTPSSGGGLVQNLMGAMRNNDANLQQAQIARS